MTIIYKRENWLEQSLEMKEETYQEICKEYGTFGAYLKNMIHEPIIYMIKGEK